MRQFGRYQIQDEEKDLIGRGGFGRVFRAFDPNLEHYVAIKVLSAAADPELLKRFEDESRTTVKLGHKNIIQVYDFDQQDGMPYLVMELLPGRTLEGVIADAKRGGPQLELLDKVEILLQVAEGLQHAHSENVIHRDIKPSNIMVLPNRMVKIMDFGIARVMDHDGTRRTRQGDIAGTVLYMAPEQFKGVGDRRTDMFSYAGVCYEFLTSVHPFMANDSGSVIYNITTVDPPSIRHLVPEALDAIILRLLSKDRELRPDSLYEVVQDMQAIVQRLRQERASVIAANIEPLVREGELESAQTAIRTVLELDPVNAVGRRWREYLLQQKQNQVLRGRIEALIRQGREHLERRRFAEAGRCLEDALRMDSSNSDVRSLLDQVKATAETVRTAGRLLAEAREEIRKGRLPVALECAKRAVALDAENAEALQLIKEVRGLIQAQLEFGELARSLALSREGNFEGALAILDRLEAESPGSQRVAQARAEVLHARSEAQRLGRQRDFNSEVQKIRESLGARRMEEALASAQALCARFPEEPLAEELLTEVREFLAGQRRSEGVAEVTESARRLIQEQQFEKAREVLNGGRRAFPGDTSIQRLLEMATALEEAQNRMAQIAEAIRAANALADAGQLESGLELIGNAIARHGAAKELLEARSGLESAGSRRKREQARRALLEKARSLLPAHPLDAVNLLEGALNQFPGDHEIATLLLDVRQAAAQERKGAAAAEVRAIESAIAAENWVEARARWDAALRAFPNEMAFLDLPTRIQNAERRSEMAKLRLRLQDRFARRDWQGAEADLRAARLRFPQDAEWQAFCGDLEAQQTYERGLAEARDHVDQGRYDAAEQILRGILQVARDGRAAELVGILSQRSREPAPAAAPISPRVSPAAPVTLPHPDRSEAAVDCVRKGEYRAAIALLKKLELERTSPVLSMADGTGTPDPEQRARQALARHSVRKSAEIVLPVALTAECTPAMAISLIRAGDYRQAIAVLNRLAETASGAAAPLTQPRLPTPVSQPGLSREEQAKRALRQFSAKSKSSASIIPVRPQSGMDLYQRKLREWYATPRGRAIAWSSAGVVLLLLAYFVLRPSPVGITADPSALNFQQNFGELAPPQPLKLSLPGLEYDVETPAWLHVTPGSAGPQFAVIDPKIRPGAHKGSVEIRFRSRRALNRTLSVPVTLSVDMAASPARLSFQYRFGNALPAAQMLQVAGAQNLSVQPDAKWLHASAQNGGVRVWVEPWILTQGDYNGHVVLRDGTASARQVPVSLTVSGSVPSADRNY